MRVDGDGDLPLQRRREERGRAGPRRVLLQHARRLVRKVPRHRRARPGYDVRRNLRPTHFKAGLLARLSERVPISPSLAAKYLHLSGQFQGVVSFVTNPWRLPDCHETPPTITDVALESGVTPVQWCDCYLVDDVFELGLALRRLRVELDGAVGGREAPVVLLPRLGRLQRVLAARLLVHLHDARHRGEAAATCSVMGSVLET